MSDAGMQGSHKTTVQGGVTTGADFFESMYRRDADPWAFGASRYELERYDQILEALGARGGGQRYGRAFEPGCSIGVLTEQLAGVCDVVEALDVSATAIAGAQSRCARCSNVTFRVGALPEALPGGSFDLMVLSEIGYYFSAAQWRAVTGGLLAALRPGGTLLAAHWLGTSADHCISGDAVHAVLRAQTGLRLELSERYERPGPEVGFRLDRWVRV